MSRTQKTLVNARFNLIFYLLTLFISFYSRKIFLQSLGDNLLGLSATINNILGFLNLAELGLGTAITYFLYAPLHNKNKKQIIDIISVFGFYYRKIGRTILLFGLILSLFFPWIFEKSGVKLAETYAVYAISLFSLLLGYFFNYKVVLLNADQKNYLIVIYSNLLQIVKLILQILVINLSNGNLYYYLLVEIAFACLMSFLLRFVVTREYPWLASSPNHGKKAKEIYPEIIIKAKQLFSHQFASFICFQTDHVLVFLFTSLSTVTSFTNYILVTQKLVTLVNQVLSSSTAGVGNLIASNDNTKIEKVFYELLVLRYWIAGIIFFCLYKLTPPFIELWLSSKYVLNNKTFLLILINSYIFITRQTNDSFIYGYGLFKDTWAPWLEGILNLLLSLLLGYLYGLDGILIGTIISTIIIVVIWKPILLFKYGFKRENIDSYWKNIFSYIILFLISLYLSNCLLSSYLVVATPTSFIELICSGVIAFIVISLIYGGFLCLASLYMRDLIARAHSIFKIHKLRRIKVGFL